MQRRIEKEHVMASYGYNGIVALIIESGVLYSTSSVRKHSTILTPSHFPNQAILFVLFIDYHFDPQPDWKSRPLRHVEPARPANRELYFSS